MADRTILLAQNKRHATRGLSVVNPQEFLAYQEDDDNLTYIVDMGAYLDGATIVLVTRTPTGVVISNASNTTTRLTQRLAGYGHVDFRVQTSAGDTEQFRVYIQPRAANPAFFLTAGSGGGITALDGDKGDVIVSSAGSTWTLDPTAVASLNVFTDTLKGITPASGGGTSNFLRADGTWATPPGGGGGGGGPVSDADYGDITVSGTGTVWTIDNNAVTLAKMADMATASLIYRKTAGTGDPEVQTLATLKTDLGLTGTNSGDQTITLTGNVTGSGTGSFATTIAAGAVGLSQMANMATSSLIYRKTAGSGAPEVNTLATLKTDLGLTGTNSGDQTITLTGDVTGSGTGSFVTAIGTGVIVDADVNASAAIAYSKLASMTGGSVLLGNASNVPTVTALTGDVTVSNAGVTAIGSGVIVDADVNGSAAIAGTKLAFTQTGTGASSRTVDAKLKDGWVSVKDFGAVCNGTTDDTTAVQNAINAAITAGTGVLIQGPIRFGAVTVNGKCEIVGMNGKAAVTAAAGNYNLFTISGDDVTIRNIEITSTLRTGGYEFLLACGTSPATALERITIENINTWDSFGFVTDSGSGTNGVHITTRFSDIQCRAHKGPGVTLTRLLAFSFWNEVVIDYVGTTTNQTGFSFNLTGLGSDAGGLILRDCEVLGSASGSSYPAQNGFVIQNTAAVWITDSRADTCGGYGFQFNNVNGLRVTNTSAGLCNNHGFEFTSVVNSVFSNVAVFGRKDLPTPAANKDGFLFVSGCAGITLNSVVTRDCTGHGINKSAAQAGPIVFGNVYSAANTGYGIRSTGNSTFIVSDSALLSNTAGDFDATGTTDYVMNTVLNSGALALINGSRVSTSGNYGLGSTAGYAARLHVAGAGNLSAPVLGQLISGSDAAPFYVTNSTQLYGLVVGSNTSTGKVWLQAQRVDGTATAYDMTLNEAGGNVGIGTTSFGTSASRVLSLGNATEPSSGPADTVQFYSTDRSAGNTIPAIYCEGTGVITANTTAAATHRIALKVNGTIYYLLANTSA
jgi:hypothetical protein